MEQRCPGKLASTGGLHGFRSAMQAGFVRAKPEEVKSHDRKTSNSQFGRYVVPALAGHPVKTG